MTAASDGSVDYRALVRFDGVLVPLADLDAFAVQIRLYDQRVTGRTPIAYRYDGSRCSRSRC